MALPAAVQKKVERAAMLFKEASGTPDGTSSNAEQEASRAEIARLEKLVNDTRVEQGRVRSLAEENERLKAELKAKEEAQIANTDLAGLSEDDDRLLGDLKDPMMKVAREAVRAEIENALKPVDSRLKHFEQMTNAQFLAVLDDAVPDWERMNEDPHFLAWLGQPDPASGQTRHDMLRRAEGSQQGYRVAEFFLAFKEKRELRTSGAAASPHRNIDHGPGAGDPQPVLTGDDTIISRAFISQFYGDKARGKYKGREEEAAKINQAINEAVATGKVA